MHKLDLGFSIADGKYPEIRTVPGSLVVGFTTAGGDVASVSFSGVAAYAWQEAELPHAAGEPWDGACELEESPLLASYPIGSTMHGVGVLRHFRLRFHPWGALDVLAGDYAATILAK